MLQTTHYKIVCFFDWIQFKFLPMDLISSDLQNQTISIFIIKWRLVCGQVNDTPETALMS